MRNTAMPASPAAVLRRAAGLAVALGAACAALAAFAQVPMTDLPSDIPEKIAPPAEAFDFDRRDVMIPMRDGVKLHTLIFVPKGARHAPLLFTRTPYGAAKTTSQNESAHMSLVLPTGDDMVSVSGYIRVYQDVRGKYGSEGSYVMNRPPRGPLNASATDQTTDAWDSIDWLIRNVAESNGRVGMIGTSYGGWLVLMALVDPHPALKAAVAVAPMVDVWRGDDWFHNGAFRQIYALDYAYQQTATRKSEDMLWRSKYDDYDTFLTAGSTDQLARSSGADKLAFWQRMIQHPAYDSYWQQQAVDRILATKPLTVPTLYVHGLWDQEDIYGANAAYAAVEPKDTANDRNFLVLGPWNHGGSNRDGSSLGALHFDGDTALWFRRHALQPFLDQYLKDNAPKADLPPVLAYETGSDLWRRYDRWPQSCESGCGAPMQALYLAPNGSLSFQAPAAGKPVFDEYVSDPAKPVPYRLRPLRPVYWADSSWGQWLVDDQRNFSDRTDVLVYSTAVLTEPLRIAGAPIVHLHAATSGSDADWVVKLIDVYPDEVRRQPALGGYQLMISADIFRGRYRESFEHAAPIASGKVLEYHFALPNANHVFLPGHRIMVQVQSSWFPLYDRNPQSFVDNIFLAAPGDYRKATQRIYSGATTPSRIDLPVLPLQATQISVGTR
jgi:putative CocE/NonD family hydrolase